MCRYWLVLLTLLCLAACSGGTSTPTPAPWGGQTTAATISATATTAVTATTAAPTRTATPPRHPAPDAAALPSPAPVDALRPRPAAIPLPAASAGLDVIGQTVWVRNLPDVIYSQPATAADGQVYVIAGSTLYAFAADGSEAWRANLEPETAVGAAAQVTAAPDGRVMVIAGNTLYTFAADGAPGWRWSGEDTLTALPAFAPDGTAYLMTNRSNLWAFAPDGSVRWTTRPCAMSGSGLWPGAAVGVDQSVYAACLDSHVYAIDPTSGDIGWAFTATDEPRKGIVTTPLVGRDGTIYAANESGILFALHPDGRLYWSLQLFHGLTAPASLVLGPDDALYLAVANRLFLVSAEGTIRREFDLGQQQLSGLFGQASPVAVAADGSLIAKTTNQELLRFSAAGEVLWRTTLAQPEGVVVSPPAVGRDGRLYIGLGPQLHAIQMDDVLMEAEALLLTAEALPDEIRVSVMPAATLTALNEQLIAYRAYAGLQALQWSPDGALLATAGASGVRLFAVSGDSPPARLHEGTETVALAFDPIAPYLAAASADGWVRIWHRDSLALVASIRHDAPLENPAGLAFLRDERQAPYLFVFAPAPSLQEGYLSLYDLTEITQPQLYATHSFLAASITSAYAAAADGRRVAVGDFLEGVQVSTLPYGPLFQQVFKPFAPVNALALSAAGSYVAAGTLAGRVQVVHVDSGFMVADIRPPADVTYVNTQAIVFRQGWDEIIYGESFRDAADEADQGRVAWWLLPDNALRGAYYTDTAITHLALHPAERFLAVATETGLVVTDLAEWQQNR